MKQNRIYITGILLLSFLSGKAQKIEELPAVPLQIGYEKTLHLIFPIEVKYYSIGGDYVIGEKVGNCPEIIRLKAAEENFPGETTLSVVTADTKFYSYAISYNAHPVESYVRVDGQAPAPHTLPVGKDRQMFLIFPAGITYVDYGSTNVEVEKAEGVDNILAVKATGEFTEDTNISAVVERGKFYTFNLHYAPFPERFSFVIDKEKTQRVAILDERERSSEQKEKCSRLESLEACRDILYRYGVADRLPLSCPLKDKFRISSPYGGRIHPITGKHSFHSGIDMAVELAAPVHATASGTVVFAGRKGGYGRCVIIRHSYGFETLYAHLAAYYTTEGKKLGKGAVIGFVGSTGRSTGYHLHYEIRKNGRTIKPYWYGYDNSGRD